MAVRAPYNFVPFSGQILEYREELPPHNVIDPALKTGEIHVTLTAETPIFVSDGKKDPHFFKDLEGRYVLPGSTVRGMLRSNMQILGFGVMLPGEDIEDRRLYYREFSAAKKALRYGLQSWYKNALNIEYGTTLANNHYSNPQNIFAGYLRKAENNTYEICPIQKYYRVTKSLLDRTGLGNCHAEAIVVDYSVDEHDTILTIQRAAGKPSAGKKRGMLLCPGVDTGGDGTSPNGKTRELKPPAHRYLFPQAEPDTRAIKIPKEDELSYQVDWENRKNDLKGGTQIKERKISYAPKFWQLPQTIGEEKPVFYCKYKGHVYFGMSRFPRVGYDYTLAEGLPQLHQDLKKDGDYPFDYPRAILGYAGEKKSYRSRVTVSDFVALGNPKEEDLFQTILGGPKPSWFAGYTIDGKHYNTKGVQLRGQKRYWMQKTGKRKEALEDKENAATKMRPLSAGTTFQGVIRYKNLRPHELGLLLWSLRLEDGCFQSIGMGKPFGFGRMTLSIDHLLEYDINTLYQDLAAEPKKSDAADTYIKQYQTFAQKELAQTIPIRELSEIKDFFFLCSVIQGDDIANYMHIGDKKLGLKNEYQNLANPLPPVQELREEEEHRQQVEEQAQKQREREEQEKREEQRKMKEALEKLGRWSNAISGSSGRETSRKNKKKRKK